MSSLQFSIKRNDRAPSIAYTCTLSDGSVVDLTNASSVAFAMRKHGNAAAAPKVNAAAVFVDKVTGKIRYDWGATDLDTAGEYDAEFQVTSPGSTSPITFPGEGYILVTVLPDIAT